MGWAGPRFPGAQRRLALAFAASLLLHAAFLHLLEGAAVRPSAGVDAMPLAAALLAARPPDAVTTPALQPAPKSDAATAPARALPRQRPPVAAKVLAAAPAAPRDSRDNATPKLSAMGQSSAAQFSDPTYYSARSLDVYPRALAPLTLAGFAVAGDVRATVFIDESGVVNDVRAIHALDDPALAAAAREMLLRARFTPAAKDGRAVKAQLLVRLAAAADSAR